MIISVPKRIFQITGLCLSVLSLLHGCSSAPVKPKTTVLGDYEYTTQYMSWLIKKELKNRTIAGLSIALVDDQRTVWAEGFGYADKENNIPAIPETVYAVGSISKLFTATAAMQLAEQGKIDIDKPLQTYLPEFMIKTRFPDAGPITPRNIMTHHSGLPLDLKKGVSSKDPEPFADLVYHIKDDYVVCPPDFVFSYSNLGVTLLGAAIQNVTNRDFASYMDEAVLRPMNMNLSGFSVRTEMKSLLAKGYKDGKGIEVGLLHRDLPAGGLHSTVLDLGRFMSMAFAHGMSGEHQILRPDTLAEMLRPQNTGIPLDLDFRIGLGWILRDSERFAISGAGTIAEHSGEVPGFLSQLITIPEHKLGVVVLSNTSSTGDMATRTAIKTLKLAFEAKTGIPQHDVEKPVTSKRRIPLPELRALEGWYATFLGPLKIVLRSDHLETIFMNRALHLVPLADGGLGFRYKILGFIPVSLGDLEYLSISRATVSDREILKAHSLGSTEFLLGEKIKPVPVTPKWLERVGVYEIANPGDDIVPDRIRLRYDDGLLFAGYYDPGWNQMATVILLPVSDAEAVIAGLGWGMGETVRAVPTGAGEEFYYSGYVYHRAEQ